VLPPLEEFELDELDELDEEPPDPSDEEVEVVLMPPLDLEVEPPIVEVEPPELVELMTILPPLELPPKPPNDGPPPITIGITLLSGPVCS
jgi:hypothetical protein